MLFKPPLHRVRGALCDGDRLATLPFDRASFRFALYTHMVRRLHCLAGRGLLADAAAPVTISLLISLSSTLGWTNARTAALLARKDGRCFWQPPAPANTCGDCLRHALNVLLDTFAMAWRYWFGCAPVRGVRVEHGARAQRATVGPASIPRAVLWLDAALPLYTCSLPHRWPAFAWRANAALPSPAGRGVFSSLWRHA